MEDRILEELYQVLTTNNVLLAVWCDDATYSHLSRGGHLQKKKRFCYECLTKKVLNKNSAPINEELIEFPKGEDRITSICFMIPDGEVPPTLVFMIK